MSSTAMEQARALWHGPGVDDPRARDAFVGLAAMSLLFGTAYWSFSLGWASSIGNQLAAAGLLVLLGWRLLLRGRIAHVIGAAALSLGAVYGLLQLADADSAVRSASSLLAALTWLAASAADVGLAALLLSPGVRRSIWAQSGRPAPAHVPPTAAWAAQPSATGHSWHVPSVLHVPPVQQVQPVQQWSAASKAPLHHDAAVQPTQAPASASWAEPAPAPAGPGPLDARQPQVPAQVVPPQAVPAHSLPPVPNLPPVPDAHLVAAPPAPPQWSQDGRWWWTGRDWVPAPPQGSRP